MNIIDSLKEAYSCSDEKIILTDKNLSLIWANKPDIKMIPDIDRIRLFFGKQLELPVEQTTTAEYLGEFGESSALRIEPLRENNEIKWYLLHVYSCDDIERLSDRSGYLKFKSNFLGNIRLELSKLIGLLDMQKENPSVKENLQYMNFDREARFCVLKTFSATVNMNELSKYYNGFFESKYQNISDILENCTEDIADLLEDNGCSFRFDIAPMIYLTSSTDRLNVVIYNLIINSFMYNSKPQKQCELCLTADNDEIIISVKDNGDGLDRDTFENSIRPYGSFHGFSEHESLGLSLAKCYCDAFGGTLKMESEKNSFTNIYMVFPKPPDDIPHEFHISRIPPVPSPYGLSKCILAKGINPFK